MNGVALSSDVLSFGSSTSVSNASNSSGVSAQISASVSSSSSSRTSSSLIPSMPISASSSIPLPPPPKSRHDSFSTVSSPSKSAPPQPSSPMVSHSVSSSATDHQKDSNGASPPDVSDTSPSASSPSSKTAASSPPSSFQDSDAVRSSVAVKSSSNPPASSLIKSSGTQGSTTKAAPIGPTSPTGHTPSPTPTPVTPHNDPISFTGTTTSTITDTPEATLSKPSFISVVESNGKTSFVSFVAPPLITILSTSKEANGSLVTFTHVVANPTTGFNQAISGGQATFFHNAGAVAGVFLVIGVILTAIVASATFILCRRRRRRREAHRRWLISINRPRPLSDDADGTPDPFQDPRSAPSPPMRIVPHAWDAPAAWDTQPRTAHRNSSTSDLGLFDVPPTRHNEVVEENQYGPNEIGLAITTNQSKPSLAQSSPSIYPPSLPAANDDHDRVLTEGYSQPQRYRDASPPPPPRPRRSHLRDTPPKGLITPPSSVSDHSPVSEFAAASPWGFTSTDRELSTIQLHGSPQLNEIMGRKTLLDVRPRSQDTARTVRQEND